MNENEIGLLLLKEIEGEVDIVKISRWAFNLYMQNLPDLDNDLQDILLDLSRMEDGEEFEYSPSEIRDLATKLSDNGNYGDSALN